MRLKRDLTVERNTTQILKAATNGGMDTMTSQKPFVEAGARSRSAAESLRGAKLADLPMGQSTKLDRSPRRRRA